tara:strand:- start:548 stop:1480 length:933 start_codon:yes stop_codon:yes gene_type:complete
MSDKSKKIEDKFFSELNQYNTYDEKDNFIQTHPYKDRIFEAVPELKTKINAFMITNLMAEHGDTLSGEFSFSKNMSNSEILRNIKLQDANKRYLEDFSVNIAPELAKQIKDLEFIDTTDKDNPITRKYSDVMDGTLVKGTPAFSSLMNLKHSEFSPVKGAKASHRDNIKTLRQEFDDRVGSFTGGPMRQIPFLGAVLPEFTKYMVQLGAGWTDWFQSEGLEQVENRKLNWDPEAERYGPGPEISLEQSRLKAIFDKEDDLKDKWTGFDTKYEELDKTLTAASSREKKLQETAIDEAMNYADIESLKGLLR